MPRARLGVALLVPEPVRAEIDGLRRAVGDGSLGRIPAHLTLVPPVNVHERDLDAALTLLRDAAAVGTPLALDLGPPATFLPDNPVLYLEVAGDLDGLAALRDRVFRPPLHRKLAWPYVPHVTVCDEGEPARIEAAATALADYRAAVTFNRVFLMREERADGGRVWLPHADAALGGRRVVGRGGLELEITESERLDPGGREVLDAAWDAQAADTGRPWDERPFALTARREGEIAGLAVGWTNQGVGYLAELVVLAAFRRQGVGGHLLAAFEDLARRRGAPRLALPTDADGPARAFYEARGWTVEATFEDWIAGRAFVQMRKDA